MCKSLDVVCIELCDGIRHVDVYEFVNKLMHVHSVTYACCCVNRMVVFIIVLCGMLFMMYESVVFSSVLANEVR